MTPRAVGGWGAGGVNDVCVVVGDAGLPDEGSMSLLCADDPGLGDSDVVDAEEALDLVRRRSRGHVELQAFDGREQGPPSGDRACPLSA